MSLTANQRLMDISVRLQMYVEGVKLYQIQDFNAVLQKVDSELQKLLGRVSYETLDGLSKAQLNTLIVSLRESQSRIYTAYVKKLMKQLNDFMTSDLKVNRLAYVAAKRESGVELPEDEVKDVEEDSDEYAILFLLAFGLLSASKLASITKSPDKLWTKVTNDPVPANGLYLLPFVKNFINSAQAATESIIRKAWANKSTVAQLKAELTAKGAVQGTASVLDRIRVQAAAVIRTAVAHVAAIVNDAVQSALYDRYVWLSVMDGHTTQICISRNRRIYRRGEGPLPPAHINCRSLTSPYFEGDAPEETLYAWFSRQPDEVVKDLFPQAVMLRGKGKLTSKDLQKFESTRALSLEAFEQKIQLILV